MPQNFMIIFSLLRQKGCPILAHACPMPIAMHRKNIAVPIFRNREIRTPKSQSLSYLPSGKGLAPCLHLRHIACLRSFLHRNCRILRNPKPFRQCLRRNRYRCLIVRCLPVPLAVHAFQLRHRRIPHMRRILRPSAALCMKGGKNRFPVIGHNLPCRCADGTMDFPGI